MALRDGTWRFRLELDGQVRESSTDDLTLHQVDVAERACGIPWALWDPLRSVRVAMGLFVVLMMADGMTEERALKLVQELPARTLKGAFSWDKPTDPLPATLAEGETPDPPA